MDKFGSWEDAVAWLIAQPERQDFVRACYYDQPTIEAAKRYSSSEEWQAACDWIPSVAGTCLDVGAGNGIVSYALAKRTWKVVALEPDPSELVGAGAIRKLSQESGLPIEVKQEFGEKMPFESNTFDLVYARQVMHHAHDLNQFCKEIGRVLKPGGRFIGSREHVISSPKQLKPFLDSHPLHKLYGGENAFTLAEYCGAMRSGGLHVVRVIKPLESPLNYAPQTLATLREELASRLSKLPLGGIASKSLNVSAMLKLCLKLLSLVDNRPGRVYSFIAEKR